MFSKLFPLAGLRHFLFSHTEMSSSRNQPPGFPAVPPSLNVFDHELRDYYTEQSSHPNTIPQYTPYLGLRARLSQVWINRWTILLALIICRLLLAMRDINYDITNAEQEALSACTSVENVGSAIASMPYYLSDGVNALAADGMTSAVSGLMDMLMLTITGLEEIILFIISMMTSTYVCLITLAVSGSLQAAITMIEDVGNFMNQSITSITSGMAGDLSTFQNDLNSFLSDINIGGLLGSSSSPPTINLTSQIDSLTSIQIPTSTLDADLTKLNSSIPTFAQVKNFTDTAISFPFQLLMQTLNSSLANYTFDSSVFPTAEKQSLTFCSDNSELNNFFNSLFNVINIARKVTIAVLAILAVLACVPMAFREIWHWRTMKQRTILMQKSAFDPMDVLYIASRPYTATAGIKIASRFRGTKRQILMRWFIAYITTLPALFLLALGVAGLFSCLCQYIILKALEKEIPVLAADVEDFASTVVSALNSASEGWANSANGVINSTNNQINTDLFGWAVNGSTALNNTLNTFTAQMSTTLNETFGGTILYGPITDVLNCLIGMKITSMEEALTWVTDNAHITIPNFRSDIFSLGASSSLSNSSAGGSFLSSGNVTTDDITNAVVKVTNHLVGGIQIEAAISAFILGLWLLLVLIGGIRTFVAMRSHDKTRAEGGPAGYATDAPERSPDAAAFPRFDAPASAVHPSNPSWSTHGFEKEKLGSVAPHSVEENIKSGHVRSSSHGYLDGKR
jgi:hypothetical protein